MVKQRTFSPEPLARVLLITLVLLAPGCANLRSFAKTDPAEDPLRGGRRSTAIASATNPQSDGAKAPAPPPAAEASDTLPTLPATLAPSTAALTVAPRLKGDTYLGIDTPPQGGRAQPVQQAGWTGNAPSRDQAWEQLRARGVTWQQLERQGGRWHLRCSVPNPANPNVSRFYEAIAADEVSAIWAVIEKIDGQR